MSCLTLYGWQIWPFLVDLPDHLNTLATPGVDVTQENEIGGFLLSSCRPVAERHHEILVHDREVMKSKNHFE